jgi:2-keto-4-pentenoate hydratase/2-oxohepta-3-ene-1,7-dioic acid hydratase in catechol pathway
VFGVGLNYVDHFEEGRLKRGATAPDRMPEWPAFFTKNPRTVTGHEAAIWHPRPHSEELDWEVELAVIIGRRGINIAEEHAGEYLFGYTVANDLSVRDIQRRHGGQWWKGKNFDSHLPLGPWIVTPDELPDPYALRLTVKVNGVVKQDSNTRFMFFKVPRILSDLSVGMELEPGDIIITGTPSGVGVYRQPPEFLRVDDILETEIEGIGVVRNRVELRNRGLSVSNANRG